MIPRDCPISACHKCHMLSEIWLCRISHIYIYVYTLPHVHVDTYVHIYIYIQVCIRYIHIHIYICIHIFVYTWNVSLTRHRTCWDLYQQGPSTGDNLPNRAFPDLHVTHSTVVAAQKDWISNIWILLQFEET